MKKLILACCFLAIGAGNNRMFAQEEKEHKDFGVFNSLSVGVSAGLTGIGVDVAAPIGNYLAVRAGVSFMPNFTYSDNVDVDVDIADYSGPATIDAEGGKVLRISLFCEKTS